MATQRRRVVWTEYARQMLDDAISYVVGDSSPAAERLLIQALEAASSLDVHAERGRVVPELARANVRQLLVQRCRLLYEVTPAHVQIPAFVRRKGSDRSRTRRLTAFTPTTGSSCRPRTGPAEPER
jgi:toxin ParE1/3/4